MNIQQMQALADAIVPGGHAQVDFQGTCFRCGSPVAASVYIDPETGEVTAEGGAVYQIANVEPAAMDPDIETADTEAFKLLCDDCFDSDPVLRNWAKTEVYSRVVATCGRWNSGMTASRPSLTPGRHSTRQSDEPEVF